MRFRYDPVALLYKDLKIKIVQQHPKGIFEVVSHPPHGQF